MKYKTHKYANASRVDGSGTAMDWSPMKYADGGSVNAPSRKTKAAKPRMAKYTGGGRRASAGASPAAYAHGGRMRYAGGGYATSGRAPAGGRMRYAGGGYASKSKVYKSKRMKGYGE